jgi:hypothetical protein
VPCQCPDGGKEGAPLIEFELAVVVPRCRSLATALSKARFASGTRPKTYTTTWDTTGREKPADRRRLLQPQLAAIWAWCCSDIRREHNTLRHRQKPKAAG